MREKQRRKENDRFDGKCRGQREEKGRWKFTPVMCWDGISLSIIDGADHAINGQVERRELERLLQVLSAPSEDAV